MSETIEDQKTEVAQQRLVSLKVGSQLWAVMKDGPYWQPERFPVAIFSDETEAKSEADRLDLACEPVEFKG